MSTYAEQAFADLVAENQRADTAPAEIYRLSLGRSALAVRARGAFTVEGNLTSPQTGECTAVFYCEPELTRPKLTAGHPMMPFGSYDGSGGQHGPARWVDYRQENPGRKSAHWAEMELRTELSVSGVSVSLSRTYGLSHSYADVTTRVEAGAPMQTSIGHHDYYALDREADIPSLTINGQRLDQLLGSGAIEAVMDGNAYFWGGFGAVAEGVAAVQFPGGSLMKISAATDTDPDLIGMAIWHRKGTPSICLEPTLGVVGTDDGLNRESLHIGEAAAHGAELHVRTELIEATRQNLCRP